jgi:hypothetical protein
MRYKVVGECNVHGLMQGQARRAWRRGELKGKEFELCWMPWRGSATYRIVRQKRWSFRQGQKGGSTLECKDRNDTTPFGISRNDWLSISR